MSLVGSNGHIIFYFQIINKSKNRKVCFRYWPLLFDISFSFVVLVLCSYFSSINGTSNILIFSLIFFFFFYRKRLKLFLYALVSWYNLTMDQQCDKFCN